jgi:hypothetical protein
MGGRRRPPLPRGGCSARCRGMHGRGSSAESKHGPGATRRLQWRQETFDAVLPRSELRVGPATSAPDRRDDRCLPLAAGLCGGRPAVGKVVARPPPRPLQHDADQGPGAGSARRERPGLPQHVPGVAGLDQHRPLVRIHPITTRSITHLLDLTLGLGQRGRATLFRAAVTTAAARTSIRRFAMSARLLRVLLGGPPTGRQTQDPRSLSQRLWQLTAAGLAGVGRRLICSSGGTPR